jgi:hypothetical protein
MRSPLRLAYRTILCLHPRAFREEFGDEMLWIFDEESRHGHAGAVLLDGLRSILVQGVRPRPQQVEAAGSIYIELESSLPAERFAQAALVAICCCLSLTLFLSMLVPSVAAPIGGLLYTRIKMLSSIPVPVAHRVHP